MMLFASGDVYWQRRGPGGGSNVTGDKTHTIVIAVSLQTSPYTQYLWISVNRQSEHSGLPPPQDRLVREVMGFANHLGVLEEGQQSRRLSPGPPSLPPHRHRLSPSKVLFCKRYFRGQVLNQ